mgnify:CR=1 FL=1
MLNLTANTSPALFPRQFTGYPMNQDTENFDIPYAIPIFFKNPIFRDL